MRQDFSQWLYCASLTSGAWNGRWHLSTVNVCRHESWERRCNCNLRKTSRGLIPYLGRSGRSAGTFHHELVLSREASEGVLWCAVHGSTFWYRNELKGHFPCFVLERFQDSRSFVPKVPQRYGTVLLHGSCVSEGGSLLRGLSECVTTNLLLPRGFASTFLAYGSSTVDCEPIIYAPIFNCPLVAFFDVKNLGLFRRLYIVGYQMVTPTVVLFFYTIYF